MKLKHKSRIPKSDMSRGNQNINIIMRSFTLTLIASLFSILSFGQNSSESPNTATSSPQATQSVLRLNNENPQLASAQTSVYSGQFRYAGSSSGSCEKYKKMKTTGIILSAVGGGLLIGGIAMDVIAVSDAVNNGGSVGNVGLYAGGIVTIIAGIGCAGAGIPLAIIGSVKAKKYCGGGSRDKGASLNLHSGRNGTGLALNF